MPFNIKLELISGGNSSSYYLLPQDKLPAGINNLRMGEILVLGRETAYGELIEGMSDDAFTFEAEIIELKEKESISPIQIFLMQFKSALVAILFFAVVISVLIHHYLDAGVIAIILILNALLGFIQEYKAEKSVILHHGNTLKKVKITASRVLEAFCFS